MPAYELVFRAPEEEPWNQNLPSSLSTHLKDEDDWADENLNEEDIQFINCCSEIRGHLRTLWKKKTRDKFRYFLEVEYGASRHCHILLEHSDLTALNLRFPTADLAQKLSASLGCEILTSCFTVNKKHCPRLRKEVVTKIDFDSYVRNYYYSKDGPLPIRTEVLPDGTCEDVRQPCCLWAWTNDAALYGSVRNTPERKRIHEEYRKGLTPIEPQPEKQEGIVTIPSKNQRRFMEIVDWLVNNAITTERQWAQEDRTTYLSLLASAAGEGQIKRSLKQAAHMMKETMEAKDYLVGKTSPTEDAIQENRIYKIMKLNNYNPLYVANLMYGWCSKRYGKRNTLWLYGPATTGKTIIAQAIAETVPFYAGVNWTNENFPFCNCPGKMLIWWEEGKMTQKIVETAKCILGGTRVPVDIKCKMAEICEGTPVIITSNTNMCQVFDGNSSSFEHTEPLQERMFKLRLNSKLPPDFGRVTKQEVHDFVRWGADHPIEIKHVFETPKDAPPPPEPIKELVELAGSSFEEQPPSKKGRFDTVEEVRHTTAICNNIIPRANLSEIASTTQCMLHHNFNCIECYPELVQCIDDLDNEQ